MKLGIYMGSFNPPHKGHISIINYLINEKIVDKLMIIPTLNYWDKNDLVDVKHRIKMMKFFENEQIFVDEEHNQYVKTFELLTKLKEKYPNDLLYPIIGADNLVSFDKWYKYQELLKYPIIVIPREGINSMEYINKLHGNFILLKEYPLVNISSSDLRNQLNSKYIDKRVLAYIKENNLYQGEV